MRRRLVGRVRSMRVAAPTASIMRLELLPAVRSFDGLGDLVAVGSEVLQRANPRIERDDGRLSLLADQQRRDQPADLLDLRQNALHVRVGLQHDHQGDRLVRHIDVDVLFLAVVEQMELMRVAGRPRSCRRGRRPARAPAPPRRRHGIWWHGLARRPVGWVAAAAAPPEGRTASVRSIDRNMQLLL